MTYFMGKLANEFIIGDTSALISLVVPTDHNHKAAVEAAEKLRATQKEIIVINAVYEEFLNTLGKSLAMMLPSPLRRDCSIPLFFSMSHRIFLPLEPWINCRIASGGELYRLSGHGDCGCVFYERYFRV
jgi:hypothetical protein